MDSCVQTRGNKGVIKVKIEIRALSRIVGIDVDDAEKTIRKNPLFGDEIHINEELINLDESLKHYLAAAPTLKKYPKLEKHLKQELKSILTHCLGLIVRMSRRRSVPFSYDEDTVKWSVTRLCRTIVDGAIYARKARRLDRDAVEVLYPLLSVKQRAYFGGGSAFGPLSYVRAAISSRPFGQK